MRYKPGGNAAVVPCSFVFLRGAFVTAVATSSRGQRHGCGAARQTRKARRRRMGTASDNHPPVPPRPLLAYAHDAHAQLTLPLLEKVRPELRTAIRANVIPITTVMGERQAHTGSSHNHSQVSQLDRVADFACWECSRKFYPCGHPQPHTTAPACLPQTGA